MAQSLRLVTALARFRTERNIHEDNTVYYEVPDRTGSGMTSLLSGHMTTSLNIEFLRTGLSGIGSSSKRPQDPKFFSNEGRRARVEWT